MPLGRQRAGLDEDDGVAIGLATGCQGRHHAAGVEIPSTGQCRTSVVQSSTVGVRRGDGRNEPGGADVPCLGPRDTNLRLDVAEAGNDFDRDEATGGAQDKVDGAKVAGSGITASSSRRNRSETRSRKRCVYLSCAASRTPPPIGCVVMASRSPTAAPCSTSERAETFGAFPCSRREISEGDTPMASPTAVWLAPVVRRAMRKSPPRATRRWCHRRRASSTARVRLAMGAAWPMGRYQPLTGGLPRGGRIGQEVADFAWGGSVGRLRAACVAEAHVGRKIGH